MFRLISQLLVIPAILVPVAAVAEAERGRLPDGRAFRTNAEGHQIVDYIAELEVTIEGLNRRVRGLEDELQEKHYAIQRLRSGKGASDVVLERNLATDTRGYDEVYDAEGATTSGSYGGAVKPSGAEGWGTVADDPSATRCLHEIDQVREELERSKTACDAEKQKHIQPILGPMTRFR